MSAQPAQRGSLFATPVQAAALLVGAVFLGVGVLGFIPGMTTDYDTLTFAGHHSEAALLGIFQVSILHNLVHLLFGVAGIASARTPTTAKGFLVVGGIIYLVLWLYGLVIDKDSSANFVPVNTADNWLHFALGLGMVVLGLLLPRLRTTGTTTATP
ncbi:DUF4383 domain-containing protein [Rhodococcus sp. NM-2]|uniref:DUF4383 domain-containing protein n=1 Tax=Rhodococcus sp. NM-2 TaxID=3401174 RepID=UPI003AAF5CF4